MDHYRLSDELRQQLLENAAWGKAGVTPRLDESEGMVTITHPSGKTTEVTPEQARNRAEEARRRREGTATPPVRRAAKMRPKAEDTEYEYEEDFEELAEAHVCPLCVSHLDEAIDEERLLEHLNVVVGLVDRLTQLQEGEEGDIESIIDETLAELLFDDEFDDEDGHEDALDERNNANKGRKNDYSDRAMTPASNEPGDHSTGGTKRGKRKVRGAKPDQDSE